MIIDFGYKKVSIEVGFTDDDVAVCKLQKLLMPEDTNTVSDAPCYLNFHNKEGLDTLIILLQHLRGLMNEAESEEL